MPELFGHTAKLTIKQTKHKTNKPTDFCPEPSHNIQTTFACNIIACVVKDLILLSDVSFSCTCTLGVHY